MADTRVTRLRDGRDLAWLELGAPEGVPIFAFHGTPGSRLQLAFDERPALAVGARLVVPDRPGYGLSTYDPHRRLVDWADDVAQLADHLDIERFVVVGISGGGPHALVCGALLPERVTAVAVPSGVGSLAEPGSEEGMLPANQMFNRIARMSKVALVPLFGTMTTAGRRWPERLVAGMAKQVPDADREILQRTDVHDAFVDDMRHASRTAGRAAAQDFALFARDWGFPLQDIRVPVHFWQGDADRNVPAHHAEVQAAAVPGAVLHRCAGEGHLLAIPRMEEILRTVLAARPNGGDSR